jgi:hypothetical protein
MQNSTATSRTQDILIAIALPDLKEQFDSVEDSGFSFTAEEARQLDPVGIPLRVQHNPDVVFDAGRCIDSAAGPKEFRVLCTLRNDGSQPAIFARNMSLVDGGYVDVSLGHDMMTSVAASDRRLGEVRTSKVVREVSLTDRGKRPGSRIERYYPCRSTLSWMSADKLARVAREFGAPVPAFAGVDQKRAYILDLDRRIGDHLRADLGKHPWRRGAAHAAMDLRNAPYAPAGSLYTATVQASARSGAADEEGGDDGDDETMPGLRVPPEPITPAGTASPFATTAIPFAARLFAAAGLNMDGAAATSAPTPMAVDPPAPAPTATIVQAPAPTPVATTQTLVKPGNATVESTVELDGVSNVRGLQQNLVALMDQLEAVKKENSKQAGQLQELDGLKKAKDAEVAAQRQAAATRCYEALAAFIEANKRLAVGTITDDVEGAWKAEIAADPILAEKKLVPLFKTTVEGSNKQQAEFDAEKARLGEQLRMQEARDLEEHKRGSYTRGIVERLRSHLQPPITSTAVAPSAPPPPSSEMRGPVPHPYGGAVFAQPPPQQQQMMQAPVQQQAPPQPQAPVYAGQRLFGGFQSSVPQQAMVRVEASARSYEGNAAVSSTFTPSSSGAQPSAGAHWAAQVWERERAAGRVPTMQTLLHGGYAEVRTGARVASMTRPGEVEDQVILVPAWRETVDCFGPRKKKGFPGQHEALPAEYERNVASNPFGFVASEFSMDKVAQFLGEYAERYPHVKTDKVDFVEIDTST